MFALKKEYINSKFFSLYLFSLPVFLVLNSYFWMNNDVFHSFSKEHLFFSAVFSLFNMLAVSFCIHSVFFFIRLGFKYIKKISLHLELEDKNYFSIILFYFLYPFLLFPFELIILRDAPPSLYYGFSVFEIFILLILFSLLYIFTLSISEEFVGFVFKYFYKDMDKDTPDFILSDNAIPVYEPLACPRVLLSSNAFPYKELISFKLTIHLEKVYFNFSSFSEEDKIFFIELYEHLNQYLLSIDELSAVWEINEKLDYFAKEIQNKYQEIEDKYVTNFTQYASFISDSYD